MADHILVLPDDYDESSFDATATVQGWVWVKEIPERDGVPHESIYRDAKRGISLHFIEDDYRHIGLLVVSGEGADGAINAIRACVPSVPVERIVQDVVQTEDAERRGMGVMRLSAVADTVGEVQTRTLLESAAESDDPGVLDAVVIAMGAIGWPSLRPIAQRLAGHEDGNVRQGAGWVLEDMDADGT